MESDSFTIEENFIDVDDYHSIYTQLWGNNDSSTTFVFLHGGPGSGCNDGQKQMFDPNRHRVVFFDQRGAGKSIPNGSLKNNTTEKLIEDIDTIIQYYKAKEIILVGGSWGSTLALAYALKNPSKLKALVLRGIFTGSKAETEFLDQGRYRDFFPETWDEFVGSVPKKFKDNPAEYHIKNALSKDKDLAKKSAYHYSKMEYALIGLDDRRSPVNYDEFNPNGTIIEISYLNSLCFMEDNYIINNAHKIKAATWIVQGRYDAICPPINAYRLSSKLPDSRIIWTTAGHSGRDRANQDATKSIISALS